MRFCNDRDLRRRMRAYLWAGLAALLLLCGCGRETAAAAAPPVEITEVVSDNQLSLASAAFPGCDWIELHNAGSASVSLKGWTLSDRYDKASSDYALPDVTLGPDEYWVVFADKNYRGRDGLCLPFGISRQGETLYLRDAMGGQVCSLEVPKLNTDISWAMGDDGRFGYCQTPTPQAPNRGKLLSQLPEADRQADALPSDVRLCINEVCANRSDWVELYNPTDQDVFLGSLWLSDAADDPFRQQLPPVDLKAGGYLVLAAAPADGQQRLDLSLSAQGEDLRLYDEQGHLIHAVTLPPLDGPVYARRPDGTFGYCGDPTPGAENSALIFDERLHPMDGGEPLRLSEAMYRNRISVIDAYGNRSDWVELYNAGDKALSLAGYYLSDSLEDPAQWPLPARDLGPGEYLLVFLSGKESTETELHAPFSVSAEDAGCVLYNGKTLAYALLPYPKGLSRNVSVGTDDQGRLVYFGYPTPGYENAIAFDAQPAALFPNGDVIISEVSADGQKGEWIELYNRGDGSVSLEGWALSDDADRPGKLRLSGTLPKGEYRVIELSNGADKAPFSVSLAGESLYLSDDRGAVRDVLETGVLRTGCTAGRLINDLALGRVTFLSPTRGGPNADQYRQGYAPTPRLSDASLCHEEPFTVTISADSPEAVIHYTLDGSAPDEGDPVYTEPLSITENTVLRAVCAVPGKMPGEEASATYLFHAPYTVPVVSIMTEPTTWNAIKKAPSYGRDERPARLSFYEPGGALGVTFPAGISPRGDGSMYDPQKSISVHLHGFYGQDTVYYPFWGPGTALEESFLILRTASQDNKGIHMRNAFATRIAADTHVMTAMTRPVALYGNGVFYGVLDWNEGMNHDFLRARYGSDTDTVNIVIQNDTQKHGSAAGYLALRKYAKEQDFTRDEVYETFCQWVDMDAIIDYVILQTYFANHDYANQAWWNADDGTARWQPYFYDLDRAMNGTGCSTDSFARYFSSKTSYGAVGRIKWVYNEIYCALRKNEAWRRRFAERYAELLCTVLTEEHVTSVLMEMAEEQRPVLPEQIAAWKQPGSMKTWEANLADTRKLIHGRRKACGDLVIRYMKISRQEWEAMLAKYETP